MLLDARQDLMAKQVGADLILYDLISREIHVLNATAAAIFQLCDGSRTSEEIAKLLAETFDGVEYVQAYEDVKRALDMLRAKQLVAPKA